MEVILGDLSETKAFAQSLADSLHPFADKALVVGLCGDLGSGKTTFTKHFAEALGIKENITSPTFVILKKYDIKNRSDFKTLVHVDAYRLEDSKELSALDFSEELSDKKNLILIEWADKVSDLLPEETLELNFEFIDEKIRKISYDKKEK